MKENRERDWWDPVYIWEKVKVEIAPAKVASSSARLGPYHLSTKSFYVYKYVKTDKESILPRYNIPKSTRRETPAESDSIQPVNNTKTHGEMSP